MLLHIDHKKNKLDLEWIGPAKITQANLPNCTIKFPDSRESKVYGNKLKLCYSSFKMTPIILPSTICTITFTPLDESSIFLENLGSVHLYHKTKNRNSHRP